MPLMLYTFEGVVQKLDALHRGLWIEKALYSMQIELLPEGN